VIAHAWYGDWGPKTGPWRLAGRIDAVLFGVPLVALFYSLAWIAERFSRRLCAIILYSAVAWWLNWIWWF
jgi:MFS superfamily sulfate permease-like transporter